MTPPPPRPRHHWIRGQPAVMMSDNGTQFVGAERELRAEMIAGWDKKQLQEFCAELKRVWNKSLSPQRPTPQRMC
jgi:phosphoserine phosphatase